MQRTKPRFAVAAPAEAWATGRRRDVDLLRFLDSLDESLGGGRPRVYDRRRRVNRAEQAISKVNPLLVPWDDGLS